MQHNATNTLDAARIPTSSTIVAALRARIKEGDLTPGTRLSENDVAQELGVSRTPVREAFIQLRQQGLLRILPQRGSFVAPINISDIENSYFIRETLELRTVELAAACCTKTQAAKLTKIVARHRHHIGSGGHRAFMAADDAMHRCLVEMCAGPSVWQAVSDVKLQIDRVRHLTAQNTAARERIVADHERIIAAVIANNPPAAVEAMRVHLSMIFQNMEKLLAEHPTFMERPPRAVGRQRS